MQILLVVGKMPLAGLSKTRLAKDLGEAATLKIYQAMLYDFFYRASQSVSIPMFFYTTPWGQESIQYFTHLFQEVGLKNWILRGQPPSGGLFAKIVKIVQELQKEINQPFYIHLTGTDIPHFPFDNIENANDDRQKIMLGPDVDGGFYYLGFWDKHIGLLEEQGLLEGSHNVCAALEKRGAELKLKVAKWSALNDIDNLGNLQHFCSHYDEKFLTKTVAATIFAAKNSDKTELI